MLPRNDALWTGVQNEVTLSSVHYTRVNVNTTDATTGATALLLPAQNTHTLHDPIRDTEHAAMRELAALRMVWRVGRSGRRRLVCVPAPPGVFEPVHACMVLADR